MENVTKSDEKILKSECEDEYNLQRDEQISFRGLCFKKPINRRKLTSKMFYLLKMMENSILLVSL